MSMRFEIAAGKFHLGTVTFSEAAQLALHENDIKVEDIVARHNQGDWGDVSADGSWQNEQAIGQEAGILSIYSLPKTEDKVFVITEADRSKTSVLLQDDIEESSEDF